jgi:hypothetical protein
MLECTREVNAVIISAMSRIALSDFARSLANSLPQAPCTCRAERVEERHFTFSAENLPEVPPLLVTSALVMTKGEHHYGNNCRIDAVHFYASGQTHREVAIWILAALFSGKSKTVALDLEHEGSAIKRLEINYSGSDQSACWGYTRQPAQFIYHPEIPDRIPWNGQLYERDLPMFDLDFREGSSHHPVNDLDKRDRVEIRGSDDALVLVAELLLNIGLPACDINPGAESGLLDKSYVLECFLGRQRVSRWSAEAQFHLPNSHSWPGDYPSLS